jgi:phage shock protein A
MAIVHRITRLFRADVHAVLDQLEEPDALLRQAIREMESAVAAQSAQLKAGELDRESLRRRQTEIERSTGSIREELDLCFAAGNDLLVRTCLRRRLECERLGQALQQRLSVLDQQIEQGSTALAQQRERLESMRLKAAAWDVADSTGTDRSSACASTGVSEADIDLALLRELQARRAP